MGNCFGKERNDTGQIPGIAYSIEPSPPPPPQSDTEELMRVHGSDEVILSVDTSPSPVTVDPFVQRISDEIAEFRQQLKRGHEQIQAMSNSVSSFDTTKSCPGLFDLKGTQTEVKKLSGVTIATQTDAVTTESTAQTTSPGPNSKETLSINNEDFDEFLGVGEFSTEDDNRFRLSRCSESLSVIEESEHESDQSPGALQRKMSTEKGSLRPKLVRMRPTVEDPPILEDDIKSDIDYLSATSSLSGSKNPSLYNSLERPLHVSHRDTNGDDMSDTYSTVSGGNTTYGSPISSPSSPTYLTPSQGSSSQETLTNHEDGDKTPVNYDDLLEDLNIHEGAASAVRSRSISRTSKHPVKEPSQSSWQMLPIDNRQGASSVGVIPEEDQEHMRQYAYDVPKRSCNDEAAILSRKEWRTLRSDQDQVDMDKYKKEYGHDDETDDSGLRRSGRADLDELAESYCEQFPFLAETIFQYLESTAQEKVESVDDLPELKKRFEELATTFRTDHDKLEGRSILTKNEHGNAKHKIVEILSTMKQTAQNIRTERPPSDIREACGSIENWVAEIEQQTDSLDSAARRSGRLEVIRRVFKIIEVMVLYVRILNTVCGNLEDERKLARQMLDERGIDFPVKKPTGIVHHNNNNHEEMGRNFDMNSKNSKTNIESSDIHILQRLLGPKQTEHLDSSFEQTLRHSKAVRRFFPRFVYEGYETVLREFHWPWDSHQTWNGVRKTFALLLMFFGIFLICRISFIPPCELAESLVSYSYSSGPPPRI